MHNGSELLSKDVLIKNELGLHARPAAMIARLAKAARDEIWIIKDNEAVDATSIIDILSIACGEGSRVTIKIKNPSDMKIMDAIIELFETEFKE